MTTLTTPAFAVQDLAAVQATLDGIDGSANKVSKSLTNAFAGAIISGKSFNETLGTVAQSLSRMMLHVGLQPLQQGLSSLMSSALSGIGGGGATVAPFADGGIVSSPTFFGSGGSMGLMGERGAEAIMPLSRGPDGRLGVATNGDAGRAAAVHVTIQTPDAESFRRSEAQVTGALARAVARGQRSL